LSGS
jgi:Alpha amylase, catalytic domain.